MIGILSGVIAPLTTPFRDDAILYEGLAANIEKGNVFARETEQVWQCRNCGYVYIGQHAPAKCPVCAHPQAYFELKSKNY